MNLDIFVIDCVSGVRQSPSLEAGEIRDEGNELDTATEIQLINRHNLM